MAVQIDIVYQGDLHCRATHGPSQQTLTTDAPVDNGGKGEFFSPTDMVATAMGTCMLTVMGLVAKRSGLDVTGMSVQVLKEMTADPVRRIGRLQATITIPKGKNFSVIDRAKLEHAAQICPVKQSLHPDIKLELAFRYTE